VMVSTGPERDQTIQLEAPAGTRRQRTRR